jgi:hypothetical protein
MSNFLIFGFGHLNLNVETFNLSIYLQHNFLEGQNNAVSPGDQRKTSDKREAFRKMTGILPKHLGEGTLCNHQMGGYKET